MAVFTGHILITFINLSQNLLIIQVDAFNSVMHI